MDQTDKYTSRIIPYLGEHYFGQDVKILIEYKIGSVYIYSIWLWSRAAQSHYHARTRDWRVKYGVQTINDELAFPSRLPTVVLDFDVTATGGRLVVQGTGPQLVVGLH